MSNYNKSIKPLNWQQPEFTERVVKSDSHADRVDEYHRAGTPLTRRGTNNGQVSALRPNTSVPELDGPRLYLGPVTKSVPVDYAAIQKSRKSALDRAFAKALGLPQVPHRQEQPQPPGAAQPNQQGNQLAQPKIPGFEQSGLPPQSAMQQPSPNQEPIGYTPDGQPIYPDPYHPAHQNFQAPEHAMAAQQHGQAAQGGDLHQAAQHEMAAGAHEQMSVDSKSPMERGADKMAVAQGGLQSTNKDPAGGRQMLDGQPPVAGGGMPQPEPPNMEGQAPPMPTPPGQPPMGVPGPGQPPMDGSQPPPNPMEGQSPPMGAPPPEGPPAAQMQQGAMNGQPPMGTPQGQPPMGAQPPGGQSPDMFGEMGMNPDQGSPQAPPQPGPERDGPKPGMSDNQMMPPELAQMAATVDPMVLQALEAWFTSGADASPPPGGGESGPAPSPDDNKEGAPMDKPEHNIAVSSGSSSEQAPKGMPRPDKQTGSSSPPTHAASHDTPVEETAQKSLFSNFGW